MAHIKPKKRLGQHFLKDERIAQNIVQAMVGQSHQPNVLEIGPGTGVLSEYMVTEDTIERLILMDLDEESIAFLENKYANQKVEILHGDFLKQDLTDLFQNNPFSIIGNFPYNISSQIFFRVLEVRDQVSDVVCMLQKEVAQRIASKEGNKSYGILSVFLQAYYDIEYLFTVPPDVFLPPPKVDSGVIRLQRNNVQQLGCDEKLFKRVVKAGFQMRRKTLRNALKNLNLPEDVTSAEVFNMRAEQLSVQAFINLTNSIHSHV